MGTMVRPNREMLQKMYDDGMEQHEIADRFGVVRTTVVGWFRRYGIKGRDPSERKQKYVAHVDLSEKAIDFLTGSVLGDGYLERFPSSARLAIGSKHREYAVWRKDRLSHFGVKSGAISKQTQIREGTLNTAYFVRSNRYAELKTIADRFYSEQRGKVVPRDIELPPITVLVWYLDDGMLWHQTRCSDQIQLCTDAFPTDDVQFLVSKFADLGFSARYYASRNRIRINVTSALDFLEYIGPCPEDLIGCFGYKWDANISEKARKITRNRERRSEMRLC